jgi:hypothetical protein
MRFPTNLRPASTTQSGELTLDIYKDAVQPYIDEPVIAACAFTRGGFTASLIASKLGGGLPYLMAKKVSEVRAGGLPEHFIIAVTAGRVYAIERKVRSGRDLIGEIRREVARWDRDGLRTSYKPDSTVGGMLLNVTIESPSEGETVHCSVGNSPLSQEFLNLLAGAVTV